MSITGARYIVKFLEKQGVRTVTGIPGGSILPLYDALAESRAVRHVLARHEQGAAFMAQGMARLTGRPGVCLATSGPGATNLVTAIADARRDGVPLVCITGQVPLAQIGTEAFQEVDIVAVTRPIAKAGRMVQDASELPEALRWAFQTAAEGRPGPVVLDIPKDVQSQEFVEEPEGKDDWRSGGAWSPELPSRLEASRAAAMINAASRPVLLLGGGAAKGDAPALALALAGRSNIPVTMTLMGLGTVPAAHRLSLGMHGMHGHHAANAALAECDLLIAVGSRFDDRATGKPGSFCHKARIIHINLDAAELGRIQRADLGIARDAAQALAAILPLVERRARREWLARVDRFRAEAPTAKAAPSEAANCSGCARGLIGEVASRLRDDAVIVTDVGQHQMFVAQGFPFKTPGRWLTSGGLGVMGFGLPAAIGASLADPEAQVVCFSGDGSLKMNIQELATLAETGANVKIVVLDNQSLGLVVQQQKLFFGRRSASRYGRGTDFAALAEAFGVAGVDLDACQDPAAALDEALNACGPVLIHARVDREAMVFPMVRPGAPNTDMYHAHPPYHEPVVQALSGAVNMG
ncbi:biosynthetic-type acetolactate synthase large subunit [Fundidesulfovibrio putealis]|uniref:biosynthetic-type acetolactate synthase large subunit n=1 Tax=Fundidesulfovibrio putealis TaxID=270496 RepID=UPI0003F91968|nr:biosynthetic-type acetolactate synthase large subunit [Fundidesulfovibrio putealis]